MIAGFVAAWSASTVAEHTEITAADANPNITLTANYAGMPFTVTWAKTSTSGTISASTTTTNAGPANVQASNFRRRRRCRPMATHWCSRTASVRACTTSKRSRP